LVVGLFRGRQIRPNWVTEWPHTEYIYQARVKATDAFNLDAYEYWWGREKGWRPEILTEHNSETAVMWGAGQGQVVYSEYFKCYIYVHLSKFVGMSEIRPKRLTDFRWPQSGFENGFDARRSMESRQRSIRGDTN
jgi:hypothetical protein